jgi:hypothetical protein
MQRDTFRTVEQRIAQAFRLGYSLFRSSGGSEGVSLHFLAMASIRSWLLCSTGFGEF